MACSQQVARNNLVGRQMYRTAVRSLQKAGLGLVISEDIVTTTVWFGARIFSFLFLVYLLLHCQ